MEKAIGIVTYGVTEAVSVVMVLVAVAMVVVVMGAMAMVVVVIGAMVVVVMGMGVGVDSWALLMSEFDKTTSMTPRIGYFIGNILPCVR